ncbi:hypothetical protein BGX38DRAFT_1200529 [Terfezia claveryi]|nr:hypothetical protein BGX38DRAFT_1200529 [Terfezia claveryi]
MGICISLCFACSKILFNTSARPVSPARRTAKEMFLFSNFDPLCVYPNTNPGIASKSDGTFIIRTAFENFFRANLWCTSLGGSSSRRR